MRLVGESQKAPTDTENLSHLLHDVTDRGNKDWLDYSELAPYSDQGARIVGDVENSRTIGWRTEDGLLHVPRAQFMSDSYEMSPVIRTLWELWKTEDPETTEPALFWLGVMMLNVPDPLSNGNGPHYIPLVDYTQFRGWPTTRLSERTRALFADRSCFREMLQDPELPTEFTRGTNPQPSLAPRPNYFTNHAGYGQAAETATV